MGTNVNCRSICVLRCIKSQSRAKIVGFIIFVAVPKHETSWIHARFFAGGASTKFGMVLICYFQFRYLSQLNNYNEWLKSWMSSNIMNVISIRHLNVKWWVCRQYERYCQYDFRNLISLLSLYVFKFRMSRIFWSVHMWVSTNICILGVY